MRTSGTVFSASCSITNEIAQQHDATSIGDGVFLLVSYFGHLCDIIYISSALHIILLFEDK